MCRVNLRSSCLTAYRRWLDRAGTFTNMTLSVLGGPCWIRTLLLIFESRSLTCAWWNSDRTPAVPELRSKYGATAWWPPSIRDPEEPFSRPIRTQVLKAKQALAEAVAATQERPGFYQ